jgi:dihydropteroate synthase
MPERLLFLTGQLAKTRLAKVLEAMAPEEFTYQIHDLGVKVAALMTADLIRRRLGPPLEADRVVLPGRFRGDLGALSAHYGVPFERGPDDVKDLPEFFGRKGFRRDLSRHDVRIFAEIVEAPILDLEGIMARAAAYRRAGADVIDLGCLPDTLFPHLEEAVAALKKDDFQVSVDSADRAELRRGGRAGADYLLSLTEQTLDLADEVAAVPVLIPARHGDLESLLRAMDALDAKGRPYIADSILDPIHFGFTGSLLRYAELRRRRPEAEILMGTGNLTELTDADTSGVTAALMGMVSELAITNVLVVQVSPHCRRSVEEHDAARRLMFAAREDGSLPNDYSAELLCLRGRKPFPSSSEEIAETAAMIRDANFRIEVAEDGVHCYNRDGHRVTGDPFALFPQLGVETDGSHAFYLGYELARAELAWRLGKRYVQDQPLDWGAAMDRPGEDLTQLKEAGETLKATRAARRERKRKGREAS